MIEIERYCECGAVHSGKLAGALSNAFALTGVMRRSYSKGSTSDSSLIASIEVLQENIRVAGKAAGIDLEKMLESN